MVKKIIILGVALVMMLSSGACGNNEEKEMGTYYSLQEAYDQALLTQEDLKSIAYYLNGTSEYESFCIPKTPEILSEKTVNAIKETAAYNLRNQTHSDGTKRYPKAKAKDIGIVNYYGTYNNCVAVMINDIYTLYPGVERDIVVNEVLFRYSDGNSIIIWKQK